MILIFIEYERKSKTICETWKLLSKHWWFGILTWVSLTRRVFEALYLGWAKLKPKNIWLQVKLLEVELRHKLSHKWCYPVRPDWIRICHFERYSSSRQVPTPEELALSSSNIQMSKTFWVVIACRVIGPSLLLSINIILLFTVRSDGLLHLYIYCIWIYHISLCSCSFYHVNMNGLIVRLLNFISKLDGLIRLTKLCFIWKDVS